MSRKNNYYQFLMKNINVENFRTFVELAPVGVVISDRRQNTIYINQKFIDLFGYNLEDVPSIEEWWILAYPDREKRTEIKLSWNRAYEKAVREGSEIGPMEYPVHCKDGAVRHIEFRLAVIEEMNIVLFTDVTDRKLVEQELRDSEGKFRTMAENSPVAIMIHQDDYFVYANSAAEQISGYSIEELYKMRFWHFIHPEYRDLVRERGQMRQSGKQVQPRYDFKIITKSGREKWVDISGSAFHYQGKPASFVMAIDITEHKRVIEALQYRLKVENLIAQVSSTLVSSSSADLNHIINRMLKLCGEFFYTDCSYLLSFASDGKTVEHIYEWSDVEMISQVERVRKNTPLSNSWLIEKILKEGFVHVPAVDKMPSEAAAEKRDFQAWGIKSFLMIAIIREGVIHRLIGFDSVKEKKVWSDEQIALLQVITEIISSAVSRQQAEKALKASEERYRDILTSMEEGYYEVDLTGRFTFFNDSLCKISGYDSDQLLGKSYKDLYKYPDIVFEPYNRVYRTGIPDKAANLPIITGDGREIFVEVSITLQKDEKENPVGFRGVVRDVTERKMYEDKLKFLSLRDRLTGIYNRTYFDNEISRLGESREYPITIIVCDLDGLKLINDTLGHHKGDQLLINCAQLLKKNLRSSDILARVGGDEFVAIMPRTDKKTAELIFKRIRSAVDKYNETNSQLPLSISMGYAISEKGTSPLLETYKEADDLMYRDKLHKGAGAKSQIINSLMITLGERDFITEGHASRLEDLCRKMGKEVNLSQKQISDLSLLAQVHDLGKVGIPDHILLKQGDLSDEEWKIMRTHPEKGHRIASASADLHGIADLILHHHEWWDGNGYPKGLAGEDIPVECRILAVVDAFDAMTSDRPYMQAISIKEAVKELKQKIGSQFDPRMVDVFLNIINEC